jgi:acyl carrier protein
MTAENREKLQAIFRLVFQLPPAEDVTGVRQLTQEKWDSLAHVSLVAALENEFNVQIDTSEALQLTSYQAAVLLLEQKGA